MYFTDVFLLKTTLQRCSSSVFVHVTLLEDVNYDYSFVGVDPLWKIRSLVIMIMVIRGFDATTYTHIDHVYSDIFFAFYEAKETERESCWC